MRFLNFGKTIISVMVKQNTVEQIVLFKSNSIPGVLFLNKCTQYQIQHNSDQGDVIKAEI